MVPSGLGWSGLQAGQAVPSEIRLATEVWDGQSGAYGAGLAWDILRQVFEPAGVGLLIQYMPCTRSIGLVKRGEADAWVGAYRNEVSEGVLHRHWHSAADQIGALGWRAVQYPPWIASAISGWSGCAATTITFICRI